MSQRRVVISGMGIVSPVGNDLSSAWDAIVNGRSGIGPLTSFDASAYATRIVGGFSSPIDAEIVGRDIYVLEYGGKQSLWRVRMPQ